MAVEFVQIAERRKREEELVFATGPGTCPYEKFIMKRREMKNLNLIANKFIVNIRN